MEEIWKDIDGYDGLYEVSNMGRVRKITYLKPSKSNAGKYSVISLSKGNKQKGVCLHRLVAQAFIPNPENKPEVNHKGCNKDDNRASELEWATRRENVDHAKENKLFTARLQAGEENYVAKLTNENVIKIIEAYKSGMYTQSEIAKTFSITTSNVNKILTGKYWTHLTNGERVAAVSRKNTRMMILDTATGVFYESIAKAAFARGMQKRTLSDYISGRSINRTPFIKC